MILRIAQQLFLLCWLSSFPFCNIVTSYNVSTDRHYAVLYTVLPCHCVHCCAVLQLSSAMLTLRCSWSWAWCWRVNFSCCFWNSLISSCFWICCCFWMRSSSCCSCLSHKPGSEPGPSILRSVRRSNGERGSTVNATSGLMSTDAQRVKQRK